MKKRNASAFRWKTQRHAKGRSPSAVRGDDVHSFVGRSFWPAAAGVQSEHPVSCLEGTVRFTWNRLRYRSHFSITACLKARLR